MSLITHFWMKPIPTTRFDWEAFDSDWDLGDPIGFGSTQAEAIADLREKEEEGRRA